MFHILWPGLQIDRNSGAYHQEQNMFRPYEDNYLTNEPYLVPVQNTHYTQLETSQLSPPVAGKKYWNTDEIVNPEEGQEDKDEEREEEEDGDADNFDEDAEDAFVEKGRKLLEQLRNTTHEDNAENDAEKANDKENIDSFLYFI